MATRSKNKALFGGTRGEEEAGAPLNPDKEIAAEIEDLEKDLKELRATYELYFMGVEKLEPVVQRDLIKSKLRRWQNSKPRNTALKFKIQQLKASLVSLENYWQRTNRQREAGTYRRDLSKVARREAELARKQIQQEKAENPRQATVLGAQAPGVSGQLMTSGEMQAAQGRAETVAPGDRKATGARPSATSAEDLTEPKLRKLYKTYIHARRRCGEGAGLRYEDMAAALRKQVPRLMNQTGARSVEFKVVIRSGKAVLKAVPKTDKDKA